MRRLGSWGFEVALVAGVLAAAAWAGEEKPAGRDSQQAAEDSGPKWTWGGNLFGRKGKPVPPKPAPKPAPETAKTPPKPSKPAGGDAAVAERRREEAAFLRRLEVCDRLKEIAVRTNDTDLLRQAEQLSERAWATYSQHTAHLPGSAAVFESDEQVLDKHLGPEAASSGQDRKGTSSATAGTDSSRRAAVKEEMP
jgi:hypothetical protein